LHRTLIRVPELVNTSRKKNVFVLRFVELKGLRDFDHGRNLAQREPAVADVHAVPPVYPRSADKVVLQKVLGTPGRHGAGNAVHLKYEHVLSAHGGPESSGSQEF